MEKDQAATTGNAAEPSPHVLPTLADELSVHGDRPAYHPFTLVFRDKAVDDRFRLHNRARNLTQARVALGLAAALNAAFAPFDFIQHPDHVVLALFLRIVVITGLSLFFLALTYRDYWRSRWPGLLLLEWQLFAISFAISSVIGEVPLIMVTNFTMLILAGYVLFPLFFRQAMLGACVASVIYFVPIAIFYPMSTQNLIIFASLLASAHVIGVVVSYRKEAYQRRDFLNMEAQEAERARYQDLLTRILPGQIAERLQRGETVADAFTSATVLFADIVGFTRFAATNPPEDVMKILNTAFNAYDELVVKYGVEKIKTIGDAYMVAGGIPSGSGDRAEEMADMALAMQQATTQLTAPDGSPIEVRVGIHFGQVHAAIIGRHRFLYDLWGDTVNTAARMESLSMPNRILVTDDLKQRLEASHEFEPGGMREVKGKGEMTVWYLTGRKQQADQLAA